MHQSKKIQRNFTTKQEDIDITLEHLDQIISNIWGENYTYTFTNGIDIIEKQSHEPILSVYCYTPYDSLKKQNNYDIMIPFMHHFGEIYFFNGKELANDFVTHYVDTNAIYFMYYRDVIKTDFKGKKIWQRHFAYNKENDIYLHTHIFLSTWSWNNEQYPSDEYICITNGFNSYLVNKEDGEMSRI